MERRLNPTYQVLDGNQPGLPLAELGPEDGVHQRRPEDLDKGVCNLILGLSKAHLHGERIGGDAESSLLSVWCSLHGQDQRDGALQPERDALQAVEEEEDEDVELVALQVPQQGGLGPQPRPERLLTVTLTSLLIVVVFSQLNLHHVGLREI